MLAAPLLRLHREKWAMRLGWASGAAGSAWQLTLLASRLGGWSQALGDRSGVLLLVAACGAGLMALGGPRVLAVAVLWAVAASGHSGVGPNAWLATCSAAMHLAAMALWLAGLGLIAIRRPVVPQRWSRWAYGAVAVLIVTGEYQAIRQVVPVSSLWGTAYGATLLVKLGLVAAMLALALYGHRSHRPRVGLEALVGVGVLVATTVLVAQPPARTVYGPPMQATLAIGRDRVAVRTDTTRHGPVRLSVRTLDPSGRPIRAGQISATLSGAGIASLDAHLAPDPADPTRWVSHDAVAPSSGRWTLQLTVQLDEFTAYTAATRYDVW
jgi:copper transport protein